MQAHLVLSGVLLDSIFLGAIRYHMIFDRKIAESIAANLKIATLTQIELSRLRDALEFFLSFLHRYANGHDLCGQNQRRLQCRFSLFSFDY